MKSSSSKWLPLLLLLLSACSTLDTMTPIAQVLPSENLEAQALEVALRAETSRHQTVTNDASRRPLIVANENEGSRELISTINYGLSDKLQFGLGVIGLVDGVYGQSRFQFLGEPRARGQTGWSGSLHGELYATSKSRSGDQNGEFGPGGFNWKGHTGVQALGAGTSVGYRWSRSAMVYAGSAYNSFQVKSAINHDPTADGADPGATYDIKSDGHSWASGLGIVWGDGGFRVIPAVSWVEYQIERQNERGFWWSLSFEFGGAAKPARLEDPDYPSNPSK